MNNENLSTIESPETMLELPEMNLNKAIGLYLEWKATYTSKATLDYRRTLIRFNDYVQKPLEKVTLSDIIGFQMSLKAKYSEAHVAYSMIIIKNFIGFFRKQGTKCIDPILVKIPRNFVPKSHTPVTEEDFKAMLSIIRGDDFVAMSRRLAIELLWFCGLRVSELCDLNLSDINPDLQRALIKNKKNKHKRWLFWPPSTHKILLKYIDLRLNINSDPALFIASKLGTRLNPRSVQRFIKEISMRAGIKKKISPHSFRHGRAHHIIDKGGNPLDVQKILGHSENNPTASFHYLRLDPKEIERRAKKWF